MSSVTSKMKIKRGRFIIDVIVAEPAIIATFNRETKFGFGGPVVMAMKGIARCKAPDVFDDAVGTHVAVTKLLKKYLKFFNKMAQIQIKQFNAELNFDLEVSNRRLTVCLENQKNKPKPETK